MNEIEVVIPDELAPYQCVMDAYDPDEQADNLKDWQQKYDQLSEGKFFGRIEEVSLDKIHTFREFTSQSLKQQCNVWSDAIWLGFSADNKSCRINGRSIENNQVIIRPGDTEFELVTPENFSIYGVVIKMEAITEIIEKQGLRVDLEKLNALTLSWHEQQLNGLRNILKHFINTQHQYKPDYLQEELMIMHVLDSLDNAVVSEKVYPSFSRRKAVVDKVKNFIAENPYRTIAITELCELAHVSRRTLQYSFEDILGISPLRYLRLTRLNSARRELQKGLLEDETIALVAERWGFWHAGQFAHDYSQLFGENPSETVMKIR